MDRKNWVTRHNPVLRAVCPESPLTVGNGSFAFTADITGLQTLYGDYAAGTPLCTLADWGWHTAPAPVPSGRYTLADVRMERLAFRDREVEYASTCYPGNESVYHWLRQNPHKANLVRAGLRLNGQDLIADAFSGIRQELHLYRGLLESRFSLNGCPCRVLTCSAPDSDILAFRIDSDLLRGGLTVDLDFPCGAPGITASDWEGEERHSTALDGCVIHRLNDDLEYAVRMDADGALAELVGRHRIRIRSRGTTLALALSFSRGGLPRPADPEDVMERCGEWWAAFWEKGGMIDLSKAADPRAMELERRIVLSLYLLAVNSAGRMPPAETGLTCNSWYGKAHLEMHFWHMAWAPLWGHGDLLARSLPWYHAHLKEARENAARNGFRGARWPKMVADDGVDSPSPIAVLLVWQQPHILVMLDLLKRAMRDEQPDGLPAFLREHWPLVRETAGFMADFAAAGRDGVYHLLPPLIPVQERYDPRETADPAFEAAYWKFGLGIAIRWASDMGETPDGRWTDVYSRMAAPPVYGGLYIAHANGQNTFTDKLDDHPSMLQCFGLLPGRGIDRAVMARTLEKVTGSWDFASLWGWDFAVMAMTALRLGRPEEALDALLCGAEKNTYVVSGHNRQASRDDLPLYLPGNGSLLLACAMMAAGWDGSPGCPGFPADRGWQAEWEGILPWYG